MIKTHNTRPKRPYIKILRKEFKGESMLMTPPNWTEICLCEERHSEMMKNM